MHILHLPFPPAPPGPSPACPPNPEVLGTDVAANATVGDGLLGRLCTRGYAGEHHVPEAPPTGRRRIQRGAGATEPQ